jgi:bacterioferritin-associated ferredoxin
LIDSGAVVWKYSKQAACAWLGTESQATCVHINETDGVTMIVCSCNVISDRDVRAAAAAKPRGASATYVRDVFHHCGRTPKCGKCIRSIQQELESSAMHCKNQPALDRLEPVYA